MRIIVVFSLIGILGLASWSSFEKEPSLLNTSQSYPDDCLDSLQISNGFTPNVDSVNDFFAIDFPCPPSKMSFQIYNRWGELIFETNDPAFQWDGTNQNDQMCSSGVYVWMLSYTFNEKEIEKKGHLTLIL